MSTNYLYLLILCILTLVFNNLLKMINLNETNQLLFTITSNLFHKCSIHFIMYIKQEPVGGLDCVL